MSVNKYNYFFYPISFALTKEIGNNFLEKNKLYAGCNYRISFQDPCSLNVQKQSNSNVCDFFYILS